jgi:hypothetical protein
MQWPAEHICVPVHITQDTPLRPQVLAPGVVWHLPVESQQPVQLLGPHGVLHAPPVQLAPAPLHFWQVPPPGGPHAAVVLPGWHMPIESQQPLAQEVALHDDGIWHILSAHTFGEVQLMQAAPPPPHAVFEVPG